MSRREKHNDEIDTKIINKVFVDRENAQRLFNEYYDHLKIDDTYAILYYWGVGGIGKSSLMGKLLNKDKVSNKDNPFVFYDLENSCDELTILFNIRKKLEDISEYFEFPRFDLAIAAYLEKTNKSYLSFNGEDKGEGVKEVANSVFNLALEGISAFLFPVVETVKSIGSSAVESFKDVIGFIETKKINTKYNEEIKVIDYLYKSSDSNDTHRLLEMVEDCFVKDYNDSIKAIKKEVDVQFPIVIGIDTFELFEYSNKTENSYVDKKPDWLTKKGSGLFFRLDNTLWVVTGRNQMFDDNFFEITNKDDNYYISQNTTAPETTSKQEKVKLEKLDFDFIESYTIDEKEINDYVISYELNKLDKEFVYDILEQNNITDESIKEQVYITTEGVPQYVEICIDLYNKNPNVTADDFKGGISDLTERYLREFDREEKDILIKMATIGKWNEDEMEELTEAKSNTNNLAIYESLLKKSFIKKIDDERFIFHKIVSEAIYNTSTNSDSIKKINIDKIIEIYKKNVDSIDFDNIEFALEGYKSITKKAIDISQLNDLIDIVSRIENIGKCTSIWKDIRLGKEIYDRAIQIKTKDDDTISIDFLYANELYDQGQYKKSLELYNELHLTLKDEYGENHPNTLSTLNNLASTYSDLGNHQKALELKQQVYERRKEVLGENHPNTLLTLNNLASTYSNLGNHQKALELLQQVYERRKEVLGENHPNTLLTLNNLANTYSDLGNHQKALELFQQVYERRKEVLGENHPITLYSFDVLKKIQNK